MNCYHCETELIWGSDNTFEDAGIDGEGILTVLSCPECEAYVEVFKEYEEDEYNKLFECSICGEDTSEIDYDYLVSTDHLECVLDVEQKKIDSDKKEKEKEEAKEEVEKEE